MPLPDLCSYCGINRGAYYISLLISLRFSTSSSPAVRTILLPSQRKVGRLAAFTSNPGRLTRLVTSRTYKVMVTVHLMPGRPRGNIRGCPGTGCSPGRTLKPAPERSAQVGLAKQSSAADFVPLQHQAKFGALSA
jgi:hypothetical protein